MASAHTPKRQTWSEAEWQAIWTYAKQNPKSTWRHIKRWFESANPKKELTQSQISKILNPKRPRGPADLDSLQIQKLHSESKRIRTGNYHELDSALYQWQQLMQRHCQVAISGLMLQEKVKQIWRQMPMYAHLVMPKFLQGLLHLLKQRYKINSLLCMESQMMEKKRRC